MNITRRGRLGGPHAAARSAGLFPHSPSGRNKDLPELHRDSLARKLSIKPESVATTGWSANWRIASTSPAALTQEQFRRETRAITRAGQIKAPGERHEKDDRHRLDDRSRYVLGWSNTAKIAALEGQAQRLEKQMGDVATLISQLEKDRRTLALSLMRWPSWKSSAILPKLTGRP
jgi:uncharacterized protein YPO0396